MLDVRRWGALILFVFGFGGSVQAALLDTLFQDHAVLQRDRPIEIWGRAQPDETLTISFNGTELTARVDTKGEWAAQLPATPAGGPFTLSVKANSGASQTINDVLVGDVFLCSGQSNMEMQVNRALDFFTEMRRASHDSIRLLTVSQDISIEPLQEFIRPVSWVVASRESVANFSAVCFFFARELQEHVEVPLGLIHASWGGSKIEPWMSTESLRTMGGYDEMLSILALRHDQPNAGVLRWAQVWENWWRTKVTADAPWKAAKGEWSAAPTQLKHWEEWGVPALASFNGMVWLHRTVDLTTKQARQAATLAIGKVDDVDITWVNAENVGSTAGPDTDRVYPIRKGLLKSGTNTIVVNVLDLWANGGPFGETPRALQLEDGTSVSLEGNWQYQIVPESVGRPPRAPWDTTAGLSVIGNAMIAPLGEYQMRGVLWYQGESNTGEADRYQGLLAQWMKEWRTRFGEQLSFFIVQLANYGQPPTQPAESGWAGLREAQRLAVANDGNAGLAIAIDLGDRWDIHPANKQQVGYRLARAARHVTYGESITASGPTPVDAQRDGNEIVVTFANVDTALVSYSNDHPIGFELCGTEASSCEYVLGTIDRNTVRLQSADATQKATRVRYCWADGPICTLFDGAPLPAGPFEIAIR